MFHEMLDSGVTPTLYCYTLLIKIYSCHLLQFDSAFAVLNWMFHEGCEPNVVTYSTLIAGLCKAGRIDDALNLFDQMLQRGCAPNEHTYAPILRALCSEGRIQEVKELIKSMSSHVCHPDLVIYNILVYGLCKIGDFDEVDRVINASKRNGWEPDTITYSTYIAGLCYAGKAQEALWQLGGMIKKGLRPTTIGLNILLEGIGREMNVSSSRALLETCGELGFHVDIISYNKVMKQQCEMGRWVDVLNLFVDLSKKGLQPDTHTFNILIHSLCKAGEFGMVRSVFKSKGFVPDIYTWDILLREFYMSGEVRDLDFVLGYLDKGNIAPNMFFYGTIIECLCKSGRIFEAVNFVRNIENGYPTDPVSRLTYWLVRMGRIGDVLILIEEMLKKGLVLENQIFDQMITAFCRKGFCGTAEVLRVEYLLDRMLGISSL
jgi:pentatricopeptide repeat protein